jgi:uncharacterized membrane protein (UPF0127 family)
VNLIVTYGKTLLVVAACSVLFACKESANEPKPASTLSLEDAFETDTLVIQADNGKSYEFDVYLAKDNEQHRRGLMFVRSMPEQTGMLFVYDNSGTRSIWMKNTYISLDLVFARADGSVSSIVRDTRPLSLVPNASTEPVNYVLELNAGTVEMLGISAQSELRHPRFDQKIAVWACEVQ